MSAWLMAFLLGLYPALYYLVQSYERYRYPVEWATVLLAVYAIGESVRVPSAYLRGLRRPALTAGTPPSWYRFPRS